MNQGNEAVTVPIEKPKRYVLTHDGYFIAKDIEGYPVHVSYSDEAHYFWSVEDADEFNQTWGGKFHRVEAKD